jgi:hypothetical protein
MLLTVTTTHNPATDLGYLLHKNPEGMHSLISRVSNRQVLRLWVSDKSIRGYIGSALARINATTHLQMRANSYSNTLQRRYDAVAAFLPLRSRPPDITF